MERTVRSVERMATVLALIAGMLSAGLIPALARPTASSGLSSAATVAPAFTSADHTTFQIGTAGTFTITTDPAALTLTKSGPLPTGVSFTDNGDGTATLAGTPATGSDGAYPLTLTATNSAGSTNQAFTLTVTPSAGTAAATVTPGRLTFRPQKLGTPSAGKTVVVRNDGTEPLSFTRITTTGDFARSAGTCSTSTAVQPRHSCTVVVTFAPRARGPRPGLLIFEDNAPTSPQSVRLRGIGR
jgi:Putative Ig domain